MRKPIGQVCFLLFLSLLFFDDARSQIAVVVNKNNTIDNLSMDELKHIYLGEVTIFANGQAVRLAELAHLKDRFYKTVLHKSVFKVKKYWIKMVFSGKSATPPVEFQDIEDIKKLISKNLGAICFIELSKVDTSMKVLRIDGFKPESAKYPLTKTD